MRTAWASLWRRIRCDRVSDEPRDLDLREADLATHLRLVAINGEEVKTLMRGEKIVRRPDDEGGKGPKSPATDYPDVTGADLVWQKGVTGQGVTVAIVDTGIARHKGLNRDANGNKGRIVAWVDFVDGFRKPKDFREGRRLGRLRSRVNRQSRYDR